MIVSFPDEDAKITMLTKTPFKVLKEAKVFPRQDLS
jgi:hypothetical protein